MRNFKELKTLTELEQQILVALREAGDWQTRQQIAARIGRKYLTAYGAARLDIFTHQGLVETRRGSQKHGKPHYEYRAVIDEKESKD